EDSWSVGCCCRLLRVGGIVVLVGTSQERRYGQGFGGYSAGHSQAGFLKHYQDRSQKEGCRTARPEQRGCGAMEDRRAPTVRRRSGYGFESCVEFVLVELRATGGRQSLGFENVRA